MFFRTSFFFRRFLTYVTDDDKTPEKKRLKHDAECMTLPPSSDSSRQGRVHVPYPLHPAANFFCHS